MNGFLVPIVLLVVVVLLFVQMSRQRKTLAGIREMQEGLAPGQRVLTSSGLRGTVVSAEDEVLVLEIAPGVLTEWDRRVIRERLDAPTVDEPRTPEYPEEPA